MKEEYRKKHNWFQKIIVWLFWPTPAEAQEVVIVKEIGKKLGETKVRQNKGLKVKNVKRVK